MNSLPRFRNTHARFPRITKTFAVVITLTVLVGGIHLSAPSVLSSYAHTAAVPLWSIERTVERVLSEHLMLLRSKRDLVLENKALKEQLAMTAGERSRRMLLEEENGKLTALLGRTDTATGILAAILVRSGTSPYDTIVIEAGERHGVSAGDRVVVFGTTVIGTVTKVFPSSSLVTLFSSPGERTTVMIGPSRIEVTAVGRGGGNFRAELPRDVDIHKGDTVIIPGIEPKLFSIVETIIENPTDPFQTILFKNPININEVEWVQVLRKSEP